MAKPWQFGVRRHRERSHAQGLPPIQLRVPDTNPPAFAAEAKRQSALVAASAHADEDQDFVQAIAAEFDEVERS